MKAAIIAGCVALSVLNASAAHAKGLIYSFPDDMQGKWCGGELTGSHPGQRSFFQFEDGKNPEIEVRGGEVGEDDVGCKIIAAKPFNLYHEVHSGIIVNAWGPGVAVTLRCSSEGMRDRIVKEYWQMFRDLLVIDETFPPNAKRPSR